MFKQEAREVYAYFLEQENSLVIARVNKSNFISKKMHSRRAGSVFFLCKCTYDSNGLKCTV